ncbi:hypothetical protein P43SY_008380 [Pythium insidiosum]|uniref:F-box domain-containing protein n=1 Tax=Pythium insidiosum TaxID=114742 RepID=A0AAD5Q8W7_PYTIN|nr:hypothetical protein P43SY_008380 [Pythium insidiosum]
MASPPSTSPAIALSPRELRRYLLDDRREYVAKPSAYAPTWRHETHPLQDQLRTLEAKLHAVKYARERLEFVASPGKATGVTASSPHQALDITTRVALSACSSPEWVNAGGISVLSGPEELLFTFLSPAELVAASEVCRRWNALARDNRLWEPLLVTPVEQYPLRRLLGLDHVRVPAIQVYAMFVEMLKELVIVAQTSSDQELASSAELYSVDLSSVELPTSVLLQELRPLVALTHLRLPRQLARDDNLEYFIAALCCTEFLPSLRVMDDEVRPALDQLEAAYSAQLRMGQTQKQSGPPQRLAIALSIESSIASRMAPRSPTGSSGDELALKFLFANQDGKHVVLRFPKSTSVASVKAELMRNWPADVSPTEDPATIRLICMGRGMLQDSQTLEACKIPSFDTHPTPVNVSVNRRSSTTTGVSTRTASGARQSQQATGGNAGAASSSSSSSTPGCVCVIQ